MYVCHIGGQDTHTKARDEEVVSCCHEEWRENYEGGLDCIWWLASHQHCILILGLKF